MEGVETQIENGLQILDQKEAELTELSQKFTGLTIDGLEDKEGFKAVREGRITLKNARVSVQKAGKSLRENAVKFQKRVIERENELIALISPTESFLEQQEDSYLALQEQARIKKEREENERIQKRVDSLAKFNYAHDLYELKIMPEENFQALLGHAEAEFLKDQERIRLEREAEEIKRNEEEERLANERAELDRLKIEYEQQRKADLELAEKSRRERELIEEQNRKQEAILKAEREKFENEKREHEEKLRIEQAKKEAAERAVIEEQARVKREAEEKAEQLIIAKREAERQEALKPDKEKLLSYCNSLRLIEPVLTTAAAKAVLKRLSDGLDDLIEETISMTKKL